MFVAIDSRTGERVDTYGVEDVEKAFPSTQYGGGRLRCQYCSSGMYTRQGARYIPHFVHEADNDCPDSVARPETDQHRAGKAFVRSLLRRSWPDASVEVEFPIEAGRRVADVLLSFRDGWSIAHEVQLSTISQPELIRRTKDYEDVGIDVMWWFGENVTATARRWIERRHQPFYGLKFDDVGLDRTPSKENDVAQPLPTVRPFLFHKPWNPENRFIADQLDQLGYLHETASDDRILKNLKRHWYPPRWRVLLSLLAWQPMSLTFDQLSVGTGLRLGSVTGSYGELNKLFHIDRSQGSALQLPRTTLPALHEWLSGLEPGDDYLIQTVLGRLISAPRDDAERIVQSMKRRARLLKRIGFPYAFGSLDRFAAARVSRP